MPEAAAVEDGARRRDPADAVVKASEIEAVPHDGDFAPAIVEDGGEGKRTGSGSVIATTKRCPPILVRGRGVGQRRRIGCRRCCRERRSGRAGPVRFAFREAAVRIGPPGPESARCLPPKPPFDEFGPGGSGVGVSGSAGRRKRRQRGAGEGRSSARRVAGRGRRRRLGNPRSPP